MVRPHTKNELLMDGKKKYWNKNQWGTDRMTKIKMAG
jgi:hypothetical protein